MWLKAAHCLLHAGNIESHFHFQRPKIQELNIFQFYYSKFFHKNFKEDNKWPVSWGTWNETKKRNCSLLSKAMILQVESSTNPLCVKWMGITKTFLSQVLANLNHTLFQVCSSVGKKNENHNLKNFKEVVGKLIFLKWEDT